MNIVKAVLSGAIRDGPQNVCHHCAETLFSRKLKPKSAHSARLLWSVKHVAVFGTPGNFVEKSAIC